MPRKFRPETNSGKTILLVDDDREYLEATRLILEREGHRVVSCDNGRSALSHIRSTNVDLLLLDYFMPGMSCEEVVSELRSFNAHLQIILQTGYASEHPPRELLRRLDIQGYYDKSDGPEKLLLWTDVGLKASEAVQSLTKSRLGLDYILSATPELYRIQPLDDLLRGILCQVSGLLGSSHSFLAVMQPPLADAPTESFLAMVEGDGDALRIRAGVGRFSPRLGESSEIPAELSDRIKSCVRRGEFLPETDQTIVPLRVGDALIGIIYLDSPLTQVPDMELLRVFANQAAVAIQNSQLYEIATVDTLTGVFVRRFFSQWVERELKNACRSRKPLGFVMLDIDGMKSINDSFGHLAGDKALEEVGAALRESTRSSDFVGRFGGDEFSIVLPDSDEGGLSIVTERFMRNIRKRAVPGPNGPVALSASVGVAVLLPPDEDGEFEYGAYSEYFRRLAFRVQKAADTSLYEAKSLGRDRLGKTNVLTWPDPKEIMRLDGALSLE